MLARIKEPPKLSPGHQQLTDGTRVDEVIETNARASASEVPGAKAIDLPKNIAVSACVVQRAHARSPERLPLDEHACALAGWDLSRECMRGF
jgi:hypothetical protein